MDNIFQKIVNFLTIQFQKGAEMTVEFGKQC